MPLSKAEQRAGRRVAAKRRGPRRVCRKRETYTVEPREYRPSEVPETPADFRNLWQSSELNRFVLDDLTRVLLVGSTAAVLAPTAMQVELGCLACPTQHGGRNMDCGGQELRPTAQARHPGERAAHSPTSGEVAGFIGMRGSPTLTAHARLTQHSCSFRPIK